MVTKPQLAAASRGCAVARLCGIRDRTSGRSVVTLGSPPSRVLTRSLLCPPLSLTQPLQFPQGTLLQQKLALQQPPQAAAVRPLRRVDSPRLPPGGPVVLCQAAQQRQLLLHLQCRRKRAVRCCSTPKKGKEAASRTPGEAPPLSAAGCTSVASNASNKEVRRSVCSPVPLSSACNSAIPAGQPLKVRDPRGGFPQQHEGDQLQQPLLPPAAAPGPLRLSLLMPNLQHQSGRCAREAPRSFEGRSWGRRSSTCLRSTSLQKAAASRATVADAATASHNNQRTAAGHTAAPCQHSKLRQSSQATAAASESCCACSRWTPPTGLHATAQGTPDRHAQGRRPRERANTKEPTPVRRPASTAAPATSSEARSRRLVQHSNKAVPTSPANPQLRQALTNCQKAARSTNPAVTAISATRTKGLPPNGADIWKRGRVVGPPSAAGSNAGASRRPSGGPSARLPTAANMQPHPMPLALPAQLDEALDIGGPSEGETATTTAAATPPIVPYGAAGNSRHSRLEIQAPLSCAEAEERPWFTPGSRPFKQQQPDDCVGGSLWARRSLGRLLNPRGVPSWGEKEEQEEAAEFVLLRHSDASFVCVRSFVALLETCCAISLFGKDEQLQQLNDLTTSPFHCSSRPQISLEEYLLKRIFRHGKQCLNEGVLALTLLSRFLCTQNALLRAALRECHQQEQQPQQKGKCGAERREEVAVGTEVCAGLLAPTVAAEAKDRLAAAAARIGFVEFNYLTAHRLLLTAALLARKTHRDEHTNIRQWAQVRSKQDVYLTGKSEGKAARGKTGNWEHRLG